MTLTLDEYTEIAINYLKKYIPRLCRDNDAIGYVIYCMAKADIKFDGRGRRESYRGENARFACLHIIYNRILNKKDRFNTKKYGIPLHKTGYVIDDPLQKIIDIEFESSIDKIGDRYSNILKSYYYDNMTMQQIGDEIGVTRERVRQLINQGLLKLKKVIDVRTMEE